MLTYADIAGSNGSARLGADNVSGTLKTSNEWVLTVAYADGFRPPWIGWAVVLAGLLSLLSLLEYKGTHTDT